jgi:TRAP-type transport system periplasmic protein
MTMKVSPTSLRVLTPIALSLAVAIGTVQYASAETIRIAAGEPEKNAHFQGVKLYAESLEKEAGFKTEVLNINQLHLPDIPAALTKGEIAIGNVVTAYDPAGYADTNLMATLSMFATAGNKAGAASAAMSGAMMEYVLLHCPDCLNEYAKKDQLFLGSASTSPYALLCRKPILTLNDMKGAKFRAGAANFTRWAESVGATPITVKGHGIKEALASSEVDCTMSAPTELVGSDLMDVTKSVVLGAPGGVFAGLATNTVNTGFWRKLEPAQRSALVRQTPALVANVIVRQAGLMDNALDLARKSGIVIQEADAETKTALGAFLDADLNRISQTLKQVGAVGQTDVKLQTATALIAKWQDLTHSIGQDRNALASLYWDKIFSKINPETYGH